MAFFRDLFDISVPGQQINAAREQRAAREAAEAERARQAKAFEAVQSGDVMQAAAYDPAIAGRYQQVAAGETERASAGDTLKRQAALRAATAVKALAPRLGGDYGAAFDFVASKAGGLFGSDEELAGVRQLIAEGGEGGVDAVLETLGTPQKPTRQSAGPAQQTAGKSPLDEEYRRAQIENVRARTSAAEQKAAAEENKREQALSAKKDFVASSMQSGLRAADTALSFFGTDSDGDGALSPEERSKGLLNAQNAKGVSKIVGAAARRVAGSVPGSEIALLKQQIKPLLSNVGLDRLVDLKASGATLGAVSNFELQTLQNTLANLEQVDDPEQLLRDLSYVRSMFDKIQNELSEEASEGDSRLSGYTDEELEAIAADME